MNEQQAAAREENAAHESAHVPAQHEYRDVSAPWTVFSAAVVGAIIIGCCIVGRWIFGELLKPADLRGSTPISGEGLTLPPEPRLEGIEIMLALQQSNPPLAAVQLEQEQLQNYGWANQAERTVRIPIRRAMEIMIERGMPSSGNSPPTSQPNLKSVTQGKPNPSENGPRLNNPGSTSNENR
jgi:hypothetical protein